MTLFEPHVEVATYAGPTTAKLAVIGEAPEPGETEPFTGPAGRAFRKLVSSAGIDPDKLAFMYLAAGGAPALLDDLGVRYLILSGNAPLMTYRSDLTTRLCHGRLLRVDGDRIAMPVIHHWAYHRSQKRFRALLIYELKRLMDVGRNPERFEAITPQNCVRCRGRKHSTDEMGVVYCKEHSHG